MKVSFGCHIEMREFFVDIFIVADMKKRGWCHIPSVFVLPHYNVLISTSLLVYMTFASGISSEIRRLH